MIIELLLVTSLLNSKININNKDFKQTFNIAYRKHNILNNFYSLHSEINNNSESNIEKILYYKNLIRESCYLACNGLAYILQDRLINILVPLIYEVKKRGQTDKAIQLLKELKLRIYECCEPRIIEESI